MAEKQYADAAVYEKKLRNVMARFGIPEDQYSWDYSRKSAWLTTLTNLKVGNPLAHFLWSFTTRASSIGSNTPLRTRKRMGRTSPTAPTPSHRSYWLWRTSPVSPAEEYMTCKRGWLV